MPTVENNLPTPVKADKLAHHLNAIGYDNKLTQYLVDGFTHGFKLGHGKEPVPTFATNAKYALLKPEIVKQKLQAEIEKGRVAGPFDTPPMQPFQISPLNLREKKTPGKYRLIHDLSYPYDNTSVNSNIPDSAKSVKYASVGDAIQLLLNLPRGSYMCKTDIEDAFRLIPIHPSDYPKLGFSFEGKFYYDMVLPMGAGSSCKIFETFSTAIEAIFLHYEPEAACTHMIDDFFIAAANQYDCNRFLQCFKNLCADIGVPLSPEKTTSPAQITAFLGIELDTNLQTARLPKDKIESYALAISAMLNMKAVRRSHLESMLGKLSFATSVVPARAFLRRLFDLLPRLQHPFHFIRLKSEARHDLQTWQHFLEHYNGVTFFRSLKTVDGRDINMASDASKLGLGACFGSSWIQAPFPPSWQQLHITILELYPVFLMIAVFGHKLKNHNITFYCDNTGVTDIINKQSSPNKTVMSIVRALVLLLVEYNIDLRCKHIPGKFNIIPDTISRFQVTTKWLRENNLKPTATPIPKHLQPGIFTLN